MTPGPWRAVGRTTNNGHERLLSIMSDKGNVLHGNQLAPDGVSIGEAEANARLIAAAPEMLEALRKISDMIPAEWGEQGIWQAQRIADAAIAKAEGK